MSLYVKPTDLDLGEVWLDNAFRWRIPIANRDVHDCEIVGIAQSCACKSIRGDNLPLRIASGGEAVLQLTIDLTTSDPVASSTPVRGFRADVRPQTEGHLAFGAPMWRIRGTVRSPLAFSPHSLEFPEGMLISGMPFQPLQVNVLAHAPLQQLTASCDERTGKVSLSQREGDDSQQYVLEFRPDEDLAVGKHALSVVFSGVTVRGERFERVPLPVSATVVDQIEFLPPMILGGAIPIGKMTRWTLTLRSRVGRPFSVLGFESESKDVAVQACRKSQQGCLQHVEIEVRSSSEGEHQSVVRLKVRDEESRRAWEVPLQVVFHGWRET